MEWQVARALRMSPFRNNLQKLIALSRCKDKEKVKKAIRELPSLHFLIRNLENFMCIGHGINSQIQLLIEQHPGSFLKIHIKMIHGLNRILKFHVYQLYGECREVAVYPGPSIKEIRAARKKKDDDSESVTYSVDSGNSFRSSRARTPTPLVGSRHIFDPPTHSLSPSRLPLNKRMKTVTEETEMVVDLDLDLEIEVPGEEELSQLLQRTPNDRSKVTMEDEEDSFEYRRLTSSIEMDTQDTDIQIEFYTELVGFSETLHESDEDFHPSPASPSPPRNYGRCFPRLLDILNSDKDTSDSDQDSEQQMIIGELYNFRTPFEQDREGDLPHADDNHPESPKSSSNKQQGFGCSTPEITGHQHEEEYYTLSPSISPIPILQAQQPQDNELNIIQDVFQISPVLPRRRQRQQDRRDKFNKRKTHIHHYEYLNRREIDGWHEIKPVLSDKVNKAYRKYPPGYIEGRGMPQEGEVTPSSSADSSMVATTDFDQNQSSGEWSDIDFITTNLRPVEDSVVAEREILPEIVQRNDPWIMGIDRENCDPENPPEFPARFRFKRPPLISCALIQMFPDWETRRHPSELPVRPFRLARPRFIIEPDYTAQYDRITPAANPGDEVLAQPNQNDNCPLYYTVSDEEDQRKEEVAKEEGSKGAATGSLNNPPIGDAMATGSAVSGLGITPASLQSNLGDKVKDFVLEKTEGTKDSTSNSQPDVIPSAKNRTVHIVSSTPYMAPKFIASSTFDSVPQVSSVSNINAGQTSSDVTGPETSKAKAKVSAQQESPTPQDFPAQPVPQPEHEHEDEPLPQSGNEQIGQPEDYPYLIQDGPYELRPRRVVFYDEVGAHIPAKRRRRRRRGRRNNLNNHVVREPIVNQEAVEIEPQIEHNNEDPPEAAQGLPEPMVPQELLTAASTADDPMDTYELDRKWSREEVIDLLKTKKQELGNVLSFFDCCPPNENSKKSAATFFQVLLDLWREDRIQLQQTDLSGDPATVFIHGFDQK